MAEKLATMGLRDPVVFALPRGGVPVAIEVAANDQHGKRACRAVVPASGVRHWADAQQVPIIARIVRPIGWRRPILSRDIVNGDVI